MRAISRAVRRLLRADTHPSVAPFTIVFIALFRLVLEHNVRGVAVEADSVVDLLADRFVFYTTCYFVFVGALRATLAGPPPGIGNVIAIGLLFGLLPPLAAAFRPTLGAGGYTYLSHWQWHFYDPTGQALSETLTLWATIAACGAFVWAVSQSAARALAASALAYTGLAWMLVVAPSLLLSGDVARGATSAWPLRATLAASASLVLLASHPKIAAVLRGVAPRYAGHAALLALAAFLHGLEPSAIALRVGFLGWVLLASTSRTSVATVAPHDGSSAWPTLLAALLALTLASTAPLTSALGAVLLLLPARAHAQPDSNALDRAMPWAAEAVRIAAAIGLGLLPSSA